MKIIMANETDYRDHNAHARGLAALMNIGHSPLNLLGTSRSGHILGPNKSLLVSTISLSRCL
jgi:hypothetical protein